MLILPKDVEVIRFPDGQTHIKLKTSTPVPPAGVRLVWPVRSNDELVMLMQVSDALDGVYANKSSLVIPYLMGARSDRRMEHGGSADLKVIAACINSCGFDRVHLRDIHSDTALQLINRSENWGNEILLDEYRHKNAVLICPDAGAAKKVPRILMYKPNIGDVVYCTKVRNLEDRGRLTLKVLTPEQCVGRHCVIVDDICDGGATFTAIADQIKDTLSLTLIVTHGIFSKGLAPLHDRFTQVITTNSYSPLVEDDFLKVINVIV